MELTLVKKITQRQTFFTDNANNLVTLDAGLNRK